MHVETIQQRGNPGWDHRLPPDYDALVPGGQRLARVNACRYWLRPGATADDYAAACRAFDAFYLRRENSFFYDVPPLPTPYFHDFLLRSTFQSRRLVAAAPRGSAKSKGIMQRPTIMELVSCPKWSVTYASSTGANSKKASDTILTEILHNPHINDDWGPEYGGKLRPPRGQGLFSLSSFARLTNGSRITFTSMEAKNRGLRDRVVRMDDIEYDPETSTSMTRLRAEAERFVFKIVLPSIRKGCWGIWVGTTISKAHLLWKAVTEDESGLPKDPRFRFWDRYLFKVCGHNSKGEFVSLWEEMWPIAEMMEMKEQLGADVFASEMMNEPGLAEGRSFTFDESPRGSHAWWLCPPDSDTLTLVEPSNLSVSTALDICWRNDDLSVSRHPLAKFLSECELFICADYIKAPSPTSDYATSFVMASHPGNLLFVLDGFAARVAEGVQSGQILHHSTRWRPRIIGIEAPNLFFSLLHRVRTDLNLIADQVQPEVRAIPQHGQAKEGKIDALRWRFDNNRIKFPLYAARLHPWAMLFEQIRDFNPSVPDGGLEHDDCIDTIAMAQRLLMGSRAPTGPSAPRATVLERLRRGDREDAFGNPLISCLPFESLTQDDIDAIITARQGTTNDAPANRI